MCGWSSVFAVQTVILAWDIGNMIFCAYETVMLDEP